MCVWTSFFFFQAEDGIRDIGVTGVQTCALPIFAQSVHRPWVLCFACPQNYFFFSRADLRGIVASRNHERIMVIRTLCGHNRNLLVPARSFLLPPAGLHQKSFLHADAHFPFFWRYSARSKEASR